MHRFYIPSGAISGGNVTIRGEAAGRISRVLRLGPGACVLVFDGSGTEWEVELTLFSAKEVLGRITSTHEERGGIRITVGQGLVKGGKMDLIIQKATELGAFGVLPLIMERSVVKIEKKGLKGKLDRWQKIGREAAEQCGRATLPAITAPLGLSGFCEEVRDADIRILLWEKERETFLKPFFANCSPSPGEIAVVIGPEGGVSEKEVNLLREAGFQTVGLGGYILRTETVALSVLSIIQFYFGCAGGENE